MLLISTHSCAPGISCTYQIQISWKLASPHLLSPKRKGCFEFNVSACGSPTLHLPQPHNCFPSLLLKLGRGSGFEACAKELGFQGITLKSGKKQTKKKKGCCKGSICKFPSFFLQFDSIYKLKEEGCSLLRNCSRLSSFAGGAGWGMSAGGGQAECESAVCPCSSKG